MTVNLTIAKSLTGAAISDSLTGGSTGYDLGQSQTGAAAPNNSVFLSHDGANPITELALNVQTYSGTYGGDYSAASDLTKLISHGDGGDGLQFDFAWNAVTPFSGTYTTIKTGVGNSFINRVTIPTSAMSRNNASVEVAASAPIAGEVGPTGNATFGDRAHMTMRYQNPGAETLLGKRQWDTLYSFNFTS